MFSDLKDNDKFDLYDPYAVQILFGQIDHFMKY